MDLSSAGLRSATADTSGTRSPFEKNQAPGLGDLIFFQNVFAGECEMRAPLGKFRIAAAAAVILGSTAMLPNAAYAQYYHHGHGFGWGGFAAGAAAGALLGGLLAAPHYAPGPYGYYGGYPAPYGYYGGYSADAVRYCMQRFRSYDPGSGTYLGYDGYRHPCP